MCGAAQTEACADRDLRHRHAHSTDNIRRLAPAVKPLQRSGWPSSGVTNGFRLTGTLGAAEEACCQPTEARPDGARVRLWRRPAHLATPPRLTRVSYAGAVVAVLASMEGLQADIARCHFRRQRCRRGLGGGGGGGGAIFYPRFDSCQTAPARWASSTMPVRSGRNLSDLKRIDEQRRRNWTLEEI